ncbi:MAG: hypothetical protein FJZ63_07165 [Chlamydiae bacterium]|nr:hypothetical protein [Chlamydiota bacterium]
MEKRLVEESAKTKKIREKLKKRLEHIEQQVTQQELNRKISEIHRWISRHAFQRVSVKVKSFSLFDENQNAAKLSHKIRALVAQLKMRTQEEQATLEKHRQP